jgi:hypothetical protein
MSCPPNSEKFAFKLFLLSYSFFVFCCCFRDFFFKKLSSIGGRLGNFKQSGAGKMGFAFIHAGSGKVAFPN